MHCDPKSPQFTPKPSDRCRHHRGEDETAGAPESSLGDVGEGLIGHARPRLFDRPHRGNITGQDRKDGDARPAHDEQAEERTLEKEGGLVFCYCRSQIARGQCTAYVSGDDNNGGDSAKSLSQVSPTRLSTVFVGLRE